MNQAQKEESLISLFRLTELMRTIRGDCPIYNGSPCAELLSVLGRMSEDDWEAVSNSQTLLKSLLDNSIKS